MRIRIQNNIYNPNIISLLTILAAGQWFSGVFFKFFPWYNSIQETVLYRSGIFFGIQVWGFLLMLGSTAFLFGVYSRNDFLRRSAAWWLCIVWVFAGVLYLYTGSLFQFISVAMVNIVLWGYAHATLHWHKSSVDRTD